MLSKQKITLSELCKLIVTMGSKWEWKGKPFLKCWRQKIYKFRRHPAASGGSIGLDPVVDSAVIRCLAAYTLCMEVDGIDGSRELSISSISRAFGLGQVRPIGTQTYGIEVEEGIHMLENPALTERLNTNSAEVYLNMEQANYIICSGGLRSSYCESTKAQIVESLLKMRLLDANAQLCVL